MIFFSSGNTFYSSCIQKFGECFFQDALEKAEVGFSSFVTHKLTWHEKRYISFPPNVELGSTYSLPLAGVAVCLE